uniref:Uncharacterized protein n=1 Tax=Megaselia scalaris TaxID=36166 RepID=T1H2C3_MEGSC
MKEYVWFIHEIKTDLKGKEDFVSKDTRAVDVFNCSMSYFYKNVLKILQKRCAIPCNEKFWHPREAHQTIPNDASEHLKLC